jgi:hypothetical protein
MSKLKELFNSKILKMIKNIKPESDETRNNKKIEKEFKSFQNKFHGKNKIWFESLSDKKKWNLLYDWKNYKWRNKNNKRTTKKISNGYSTVKIISYPPSFKHFIEGSKNTWKYRVDIQKLRDKYIELLLKEK